LTATQRPKKFRKNGSRELLFWRGGNFVGGFGSKSGYTHNRVDIGNITSFFTSFKKIQLMLGFKCRFGSKFTKKKTKF
jgi:hypothetical protein